MLIGLSLARCIKDIVSDEVHESDVLCIIAQSRFDWETSNAFDELWNRHSNKNLFNNDTWFNLDKDLVYELIDFLWYSGKIHQPRRFSSMPVKLSDAIVKYHWLECILPQEHLTPAVKDAWEQYKFLAGLTGEEKLIDK